MIASRVRDAVSSYYGREVTEDATLRAITGYTLQDSTVYGSWSESYPNDNCYAYEVAAKPLLSEMDEDQCMEILSDLGVTIPAELKDVDIQGIVEELESDPNMPAPILSYTPMVELFKDIRTAVTEYHEVAASSCQPGDKS